MELSRLSTLVRVEVATASAGEAERLILDLWDRLARTPPAHAALRSYEVDVIPGVISADGDEGEPAWRGSVRLTLGIDAPDDWQALTVARAILETVEEMFWALAGRDARVTGFSFAGDRPEM